MITENTYINDFKATYIPSTNGAQCLVLKNVRGFNTEKTFDCGQCFRFDKVSGTKHQTEYAGVAGGRFFSVAQDGDTLYIYNCDRVFFDRFLCRFLTLDMDYREVRNEILSACGSEYMKRISDCGDGIHILRQDAWEALCSFIISQNNNIPRIKKLVRVLSERCGKTIPQKDLYGMETHGAGDTEYAFPTAASLDLIGEEELKKLKVGFRAGYIADAARKVATHELDLGEAAVLDTKNCLDALMSVKGVGLKVASCTALFGMEKYDAFPIDVWIRRVLAEHFEADFTPLTLGRYAGIAQQYMFYSARFNV